jgi:hypothetical protein
MNPQAGGPHTIGCLRTSIAVISLLQLKLEYCNVVLVRDAVDMDKRNI